MRLAYSALLAVIIGVVLVSSPLILTGLSPTDLRAKTISSEPAPENQRTFLNNESFSYLVVGNETSQVKTSIVTEAPHSLNGVLISLILGIATATLSYILIKREIVGRIKFNNQ